MTPTQRQFLQATLRSIIESSSTMVQVDLNRPESGVAFTIKSRETPASPLASNMTPTQLNQPSQPSQPSLEETVEALIRKHEDTGAMILIRHDGSITEIGWRKNSFVRETKQDMEKTSNQPQWSIGKTTHIDPARDADLLKAIGIMANDGEIKAPMRKKYKQINHFLGLLLPIMKETSVKKPLTIIDCGCGKSYLGFAAFWHLRRVLKRKAQFVGIDLAPNLIEACRERATRMNLDGMKFICGSIHEARLPKRPDIVFSLHACDTATDEALACGVAHEAKAIVAAPCCQHEFARQIKEIPFYPLAKHGIFTQRFCDLLTDMARSLFLEAHGYTVTAGEFISSEETPKNLLIRAKRGNANPQERMRQYEEFKNEYTLFPSIDHFLEEQLTKQSNE